MNRILAATAQFGGALGSLSQLLTILAIFLLVLFLAWFSARLLARYNRTGAGARGNIELMEAFRLSASQVVEIVRIGDRYVALAVSKEQVTKLGEWSKEELRYEGAGKEAPGSMAVNFGELLKKYGRRGGQPGEKAGASPMGTDLKADQNASEK